MEDTILGEDGWYRGSDLMNSQKKLLLKTIIDAIKEEQGELLYLLDCKEKNSETYHQYKKNIEWLHANEQSSEKEKEVEEQMAIIDKAQGAIVQALQALFSEKFTQVAHKISPGISYNEALRQDVRNDFIFGERDIYGSSGNSTDNYRLESRYRPNEAAYQKKMEKNREKRKKDKEKIILPVDHMLITEKNYKKIVKEIVNHMEQSAMEYSKKSLIDVQQKNLTKKIIEDHFMYCFVKALIDTKLVFNIKSTRGGQCRDLTIDEILNHFNSKLHTNLDIKPINIKRKLWHNANNSENPTDLSYKHAMIDDIDYRENYINTTYLSNKGTNINEIRIASKKEYDAQKGLIEKSLELINPWYHIYKEEVHLHQKHLDIVQKFYSNSAEKDPQIENIIEDIKKKLFHAQEMKIKYTLFENDEIPSKGKYNRSITEIQQKYLRKYQIPAQYWNVFGIVINKINHYYQIKAAIIKKADEVNDALFQQLADFYRTFHDFSTYSRNYRTNAYIDAACTKKRTQTRKKRTEKRFPSQTTLDF